MDPNLAGPRTPTTSIGTLQVILALMRQVGVDTDVALERAGLSADALKHRARIPVNTMTAIWDAAEVTSGNGLLGFEMAELAKPEMLDVVGYCVKLGDTLGDVLERWKSYSRLLGDLFLFEVQHEGEQTVMQWTGGSLYAAHPQAANTILAGMGTFGDYMAGKRLTATEIRFAYPRPDNADAIREHIAERTAKIVFDAPYNAVVFPSIILTAPNRHRDPRLLGIIERQADAMLSDLPEGAGLSIRVSSVIAQELKAGNASSPRVAEKLGMSQRTMRRRLDEAGIQYRDLFDQVRRDLALRYLRDTDLDIGEIAFNLTFASIGGFGRAFKRWTGDAPSDYRRRHR